MLKCNLYSDLISFKSNNKCLRAKVGFKIQIYFRIVLQALKCLKAITLKITCLRFQQQTKRWRVNLVSYHSNFSDSNVSLSFNENENEGRLKNAKDSSKQIVSPVWRTLLMFFFYLDTDDSFFFCHFLYILLARQIFVYIGQSKCYFFGCLGRNNKSAQK